jgi:hypothetical protein
MTSVLCSFDVSYLSDVWVGVLYDRLVHELERAHAGHCLRVSDLPRGILENLAAQLYEGRPQGSEVYLVDKAAGPEPWRVGVHKVVERRNEEDCVLLALFPPDLLLAAGDSVDVSTFRAIPVDDVPGLELARLAGRSRTSAESTAHSERLTGMQVSDEVVAQ